MDINIDAPNKSLTLNFTDAEWEIAIKARARDQAEFRNMIVNWLKGKALAFETEDQEAIAARLRVATQEEIDAIKLVLGIT